jgi:hypothetical protein
MQEDNACMPAVTHLRRPEQHRDRAAHRIEHAGREPFGKDEAREIVNRLRTCTIAGAGRVTRCDQALHIPRTISLAVQAGRRHGIGNDNAVKAGIR